MAQDKPARDALHTYEIAFPYFHPSLLFKWIEGYLFSLSFSLSLFLSLSCVSVWVSTYACVSFRGMEILGRSAGGGVRKEVDRRQKWGGWWIRGIRGRRQAAWHEERSSAPRF